jgi:uncharacterized repeat protein (TIGR03803 family)
MSAYSYDGANPYAGLMQGSDGYLYGTTCAGGTNPGPYWDGYGTVFKISTNGAYTSLYSFTGGNDGAYPEGGLVQGSNGYLYGTTLYGGTNGWGTVFKISCNGALTTLYSFTGGNDGACPIAGLVQGSDGYLYGTTCGGTNNHGAVFKISINGALTSLHSFNRTNDGANPYVGLVQGRDCYLYGMTELGGTNNYGTVFKISTNGSYTNLYSFTGPRNNLANPFGGLVQGSDGYLYGTKTSEGNYGTVFKISTNGAYAILMDGYLESGWYGTWYRQTFFNNNGLNYPFPPDTVITNTQMGLYSAPIIYLQGMNQFVASQGGGTYSIVVYTGTGNAFGDGEDRHSEYWLETVTEDSGPPVAITDGVTNSAQYYLVYNTFNHLGVRFRLREHETSKLGSRERALFIEDHAI